MAKRGFKGASIFQTACFFVVAFVWSIAENRADVVAFIVIGWLLFALGAIQTALCFAMPEAKNTAVVCGLSVAADMALGGALIALFVTQIGFSQGGVSLFNDVFTLVLFVVILVAVAATYVCGVTDRKG